MRFHIQFLMMIGCVAAMVAIPACSLADEAPVEEQRASATRTWGSESGKADRPQDDELARAIPPVECTTHSDCAVLPKTAHWCSPDGQCEYSCESGFADANGEAEADGCECEVRSEGPDVCDGHDADCDGVIDNPFAGGALDSGGSHSCATDRYGALRCWGADSTRLSPQEAGVRLWKVATGNRHSCGLTEAGRVYCWGDDAYGKLGVADGEGAERPTPVDTDGRFVEVAVGGDHSCALTREGRIECWGRNDYGQLGDSTLTSRHQPEPIAASLEFESVAAGRFHACGLTVSGQVLCWGANQRGQTGQVDVSAVNAPSPVDAPVDFVSVTLGADHSCALDIGGMVYCWGDNEYGQLASSSGLGRAQARPIDDAEMEFAALDAGANHTCALTQTGRLFCWGHNGSGRLGIEQTVATSAFPRPAGAELHFETIAAGGAHSCAMTTDGLIYCWGEGADGQLGPGSTGASRSPMRADCP